MKRITLREGWTVIELILVILVIGILAVVALPRLAATRDDASISADVFNMSTCIRDATTTYMAYHVDFTEENTSLACESVVCYNIEYAVNGQDFNVSTNPGAASFCKDIEYVGGHLAKSYNFGGSHVKQ